MQRHDTNPVQIAGLTSLAILAAIIIAVVVNTISRPSNHMGYYVIHNELTPDMADTIEASSRRNAFLQYLAEYNLQQRDAKYIHIKEIEK